MLFYLLGIYQGIMASAIFIILRKTITEVKMKRRAEAETLKSLLLQ